MMLFLTHFWKCMCENEHVWVFKRALTETFQHTCLHTKLFHLLYLDKNLRGQRAEGDLAYLQAHQAVERTRPHQSPHAPTKAASGHPSVRHSDLRSSVSAYVVQVGVRRL